jgi:hypothetical protein
MTDESLLVRYLVDDCSEDEKARVEEQAFSNDETFERLCELEEALVSQYLSGQLAREVRPRFEQAYRVSPRRERLLFNAALQRAFSETAADASRRVPAWRRWLALEPLPLRFALAAATVALAVAAGWAVRQADEARTVSETARREVLALQEQAAAAQAAGGGRRSEPVVATFILSPGLTRSGGREPRLAVPSGADSVRLQLDLEATLSYRSFRADLRTVAGAIAWSQDRLQAESTDYGRAVPVALPASVLPEGAYELTLRGLRDDGRFEDAASYYFRIGRP